MKTENYSCSKGVWSVSVGDTYLIKKEDKVQFSVSRFAVAQAVKDFFLQAPFPAPRLITQIINRAMLKFKKVKFFEQFAPQIINRAILKI